MRIVPPYLPDGASWSRKIGDVTPNDLTFSYLAVVAPFTPEVVIEHPDALMQLHREFLRAGVDVLQTIQTEKVTHAQFVPTMINMLVNHPDVGKYDLSSVERLLFGASPMPEAAIRTRRGTHWRR